MATHTLSVLVDNHSGVLSRVVGLFTRRAYNIDSLAVGKTHDINFSRITIELDCESDEKLDQVISQILKLPSVITVTSLDSKNSVKRELVLAKVQTDENKDRSRLIEIANVFRASIVDVSKSSMTIQMTGSDDKIRALIEMIGDFGIMEIVRTGAIALHRGVETIDSSKK